MPDVVSDEELNALAAEYVLGTLDYEERKGASALLEVDPTFRGIVRIWERRFGELHLMVESVEPGPQVWARIRPQVPGIEQVTPAIPSHADAIAAAAALIAAASPPGEAAAVPAQADAATKADAAAAEAAAPAVSETPPAAPELAEPKAEEPKPEEPEPAEPKPAEPELAGLNPAALQLAESEAAESKPPEPQTVSAAETELKLEELAALLPVTGAAQEGARQGTAQPDAVPEDPLHARAAEEIPRGFVPPVPMSTHGASVVIGQPVGKSGRGWMAGTLAMGLVAVVLAGLISAWRFFPERLPAELQAYSVLNLVPPRPAPPSRPQRSTLPAFDE